jgi:hypothetical protein
MAYSLMDPNEANELPMNPPISVCVPMYNNSATIERCLRSVLDQEGVEFEIVVVDDDSSDESAAIATRMLRPGDRLIHNESRAGLNQNHNKCLALARGRCIQFVHGDDWLLPGPPLTDTANISLQEKVLNAGTHVPSFGFITQGFEPVNCEMWSRLPVSGAKASPTDVFATRTVVARS